MVSVILKHLEEAKWQLNDAMNEVERSDMAGRERLFNIVKTLRNEVIEVAKLLREDVV